MERINLLKIAHCLRLDGMGAYRATMIEYAEKINQLQEQVEELQNQLSAEIMTRLVSPSEPREVVEELGNGWRIERQPSSPNANAATSVPPANCTTTVEDIDRQMTGVGRLLAAYQRTQQSG